MSSQSSHPINDDHGLNLHGQSSHQLSALALQGNQLASEKEGNIRDWKLEIARLIQWTKEAEEVAEQSRQQAKLMEQASKKALFKEQCADRHQQFPNLFNDHVIKEIKEAMREDQVKLRAMESVLSDHASQEQLDIFKCLIMDALAGTVSHAENASTVGGSPSLGGVSDPLMNVAKMISAQLQVDEDEAVIEQYKFHNQQEVGGDHSMTGEVAKPATHQAQTGDDNMDPEQHRSGHVVGELATNIPNSTPDTMIASVVLPPDAHPITCGNDIDGMQDSATRKTLAEIEVMEQARDTTTPVDVRAVLDGSSAATTTVVNIDDASTETRGRSSIASSDKTPKRRRDDLSVASQETETTLTTPKKLRPTQKSPKVNTPEQRFAQNLEQLASVGTSVDPELKCQYCQSTPTDPRLSGCLHLYCNKCVTRMRRVSKTSGSTVVCCKCNEDLGSCKKFSEAQVDSLKEEYGVVTDDEDVEDDEDDDVEKGEGDSVENLVNEEK